MQAADPPQPSQDVGHIASEHSPVGVHIVDDHVVQVTEEVRPAIVLREDPQVQHVRIGEDDLRLLANRSALRGGRIAVVCAPRKVGQPKLGEPIGLILGQGFGRKEIQRTRILIVRQRFQHGQVIAQRLSARGGRDDDHVRASARRGHRLDLVRVQARDALRPKRLLQHRRQRRIQLCVARRPGGNETFVDDLAIVPRLSLQFLKKRADVHPRDPSTTDAGSP